MLIDTHNSVKQHLFIVSALLRFWNRGRAHLTNHFSTKKNVQINHVKGEFDESREATERG